jgi:hypothetical protein
MDYFPLAQERDSCGLLWQRWPTLGSHIYRCPKKVVPFLIFICVCGEWCKLHWLLLDIPTFDWNTSPFPWAQNFQDGAHQTTGAQRKIFKKGTIFFGHPVYSADGTCTRRHATTPVKPLLILFQSPQHKVPTYFTQFHTRTQNTLKITVLKI